jgi:phenylpyruvate tautomerase PptA (4-oxalocrotonate tautomerase family)
MPIVDVKIVTSAGTTLPEGTAKVVAEALAAVFQAPEGRVWVRLQQLAEHLYAANGSAESVHPVFITVPHADLPPREALAAQALAVSKAVAGCLKREPEQVHVEYAPPGRGRVAFGGKLVQ